MTITEIKALTEVAVIEQAIIDNAADQTVVDNLKAQLAAVYAANALTQKQGATQQTAMAYDARTRIPLISNILPNGITLVAIGETGTPSTAQAAAGMVPIMVQLKISGQLRWTAATIMNNVQPIAANLTLSVSSYTNKAGAAAYSIEASFGGRQAAIRVGIDQLREEVEFAKLQAELFLAQNSIVKDCLATSILRKQDEQFSKVTKD